MEKIHGLLVVYPVTESGFTWLTSSVGVKCARFDESRKAIRTPARLFITLGVYSDRWYDTVTFGGGSPYPCMANPRILISSPSRIPLIITVLAELRCAMIYSSRAFSTPYKFLSALVSVGLVRMHLVSIDLFMHLITSPASCSDFKCHPTLTLIDPSFFVLSRKNTDPHLHPADGAPTRAPRLESRRSCGCRGQCASRRGCYRS